MGPVPLELIALEPLAPDEGPAPAGADPERVRAIREQLAGITPQRLRDLRNIGLGMSALFALSSLGVVLTRTGREGAEGVVNTWSWIGFAISLSYGAMSWARLIEFRDLVPLQVRSGRIWMEDLA